MAANKYTALLLGAAVVGGLLLAGGTAAAAAPGGQDPCVRLIGKQFHDNLKRSPRHAILTAADMVERVGQHQTGACLRRMADDPTVDCTELMIQAVASDLKAIVGNVGATQAAIMLRGWAAQARAIGQHQLADCYDQLASQVG